MPAGRLPINLSGLVVEKRAIRREAVTLRLPMPPSVNHLFLNVPGRGRVISSHYKSWKADAGNRILQLGHPHVIGPVEICVAFQEEGCRVDLGNLEKALTDLLVSQRVIDGDSKKTVRRLVLEWGEGPGAIVQVIPVSGEWKTRRGAGKAVALSSSGWPDGRIGVGCQPLTKKP